MYVTMYACMHLCMCMCVGECVCMYIYYKFCTYGVFCYVMGGGTVVSVYSFCILYVLLFVDFLQ